MLSPHTIGWQKWKEQYWYDDIIPVKNNKEYLDNSRLHNESNADLAQEKRHQEVSWALR